MIETRDAPDITIVTGASGWLGHALLSAFGDEAGPHHRRVVRALVTSAAEADTLRGHACVVPIVGDVTTPDGLAELFSDCGPAATVDVIHAAGVIHPATTSEFVEINVRGTVNVAALARRAGIRRFVHVSSNSPFGSNSHRLDRFRDYEPYHPYLGYGRSKMLAELRLLDEVGRGLDAVIVRPPWFYGPHQPARQTTFFTLVRTGRFPIVGDGRHCRSMVYVDNLVEGIVRAELTPTSPGRAWWVADARPYEMNEIVSTVKAVLGDAGYAVSRRQLRLPDVVGRVAEMADRAVQRTGRYVTPLHVLGELNKTIACDVSGARRDLGYQPTVDLAEGMRRSVAWCRDQGIDL